MCQMGLKSLSGTFCFAQSVQGKRGMKKPDITAEVQRALTDLGVVVRRPAYGTIETWCLISGMSRRGTYKALARGNLTAVKNGNRTLINIEAGLRWLQTLPLAQIHPARA
jgi:hypothetical protein